MTQHSAELTPGVNSVIPLRLRLQRVCSFNSPEKTTPNKWKKKTQKNTTTTSLFSQHWKMCPRYASAQSYIKCKQPRYNWAPAAAVPVGGEEAPGLGPVPAPSPSHFLSGSPLNHPLGRTNGRTKGRLTGSVLLWPPGGLVSSSNPPASAFTGSGVGPESLHSNKFQVLLLWGPHFENHWPRGLSPTPGKHPFWGNCAVLWNTRESYHSPLSTPSL